MRLSESSTSVSAPTQPLSIRMTSTFSNKVLTALAWAALAVLVSAAASYLMDGTVAVTRAIQEQSENPVMLWTNAFLALTCAPIVETALMAVLIIVLLRMKINRYVVMLICAALAAVAHEMMAPVPVDWSSSDLQFSPTCSLPEIRSTGMVLSLWRLRIFSIIWLRLPISLSNIIQVDAR